MATGLVERISTFLGLPKRRVDTIIHSAHCHEIIGLSEATENNSVFNIAILVTKTNGLRL